MKYSGIGSRQTPPHIIEQMKSIAKHLAQLNWLLRSGGADGADLAFEAGCDEVGGQKEIFLPWKGFNNSKSTLYNPTVEAFQMAATIHPVYKNLSIGAQKLHARNCHQILGSDLNDPVSLVVCWTKDGSEKGGTATALKIAKRYDIRIINLAVESFDFTEKF